MMKEAWHDLYQEREEEEEDSEVDGELEDKLMELADKSTILEDYRKWLVETGRIVEGPVVASHLWLESSSHAEVRYCVCACLQKCFALSFFITSISLPWSWF